MISVHEQVRLLETVRYARERSLLDAAVERIGGATVIVKPGDRGEYPSRNGNHVHALGVFEPATEALIDEIVAHYRSAGLSRFFVYLSPCDQADEIERWLLCRGMWERLPQDVLYRAAPVEPIAVSLPVSMGDDIAYAESVGDLAGKVGVTLFSAVAGDGDESWEDQAYGALFVDGVAAYFGPAGTRDGYRRRGGQTALIAARLNRAAELGCEHAFAETYKRILATSYNNLLRGGFTHTYSCPIYVWELD